MFGYVRRGRCIGAALAALVLLTAANASGATWVGARTTPSLREIVALDATGEAGWLYGQEDVAGDGLASFKPPEQSIDIRTAYAATDSTRFWVRVYAVNGDAIGENVTVFVFIDADRDSLTGGKAAAAEINAAFTVDPSPGGYEYVIGLRGNGTVTDVWEWRAPTSKFTSIAGAAARSAAEAGKDTDPIRINERVRAYVQGAVQLNEVGLNQVCNANVFVRSINETAGLGPGDLEAGKVGPCVPVDGDGNKVPDLVSGGDGCTSDTQCAAGGVCVNGRCVVAVPCVSEADCPSGYTCSSDGRCVAKGGTACSTNDQCSDLVCRNSQCAPCTLEGSECGAGRRCGPDGRCVAGSDPGGGGGGDGGIALQPGERIEGGAFHCAASTGSSAGGSAAAFFVAFAIARRVRRRLGKSAVSPEHRG